MYWKRKCLFLRTLTTGIQRFENYAAEHTSVDGEFAFELFDTYGFPIDLTELLSREKGLQVDMEGFNIALQQQKERSRAATAIDTGDWVVVQDDDESTFVGYDYLEATTQILKYRKVSAKGKDQYQLVLSVTPFYAEGGGQVGDSGLLISEANEKVHIIDTKKKKMD